MENNKLMELLGVQNPSFQQIHHKKYDILQFGDSKTQILASEFKPRLILAKVFNSNDKINDIDINNLVASIDFAVKKKLYNKLLDLDKKYKDNLIMVVYGDGRTVLVCPKIDKIVMDKINPDQHDFTLAYKKYLSLGGLKAHKK